MTFESVLQAIVLGIVDVTVDRDPVSLL